jgi:hypothetical protein
MPATDRGRYSQFELTDDSSSSTDEPPKFARWRAPILISTALVTAAVLAVGHHVMGFFLTDKRVDDLPVSQAWIFRFSAALAFLVKTALAIAVGTSYAQQQWLRFQRTTFILTDVDALTGVLENALNLSGTAVWFTNPKLTLIALVSL